MLYSDRKTIVTIVGDDKVKETISIIKTVADTGTPGAGVIFVSSVEEVIEI